jgi:hypothetical protein
VNGQTVIDSNRNIFSANITAAGSLSLPYVPPPGNIAPVNPPFTQRRHQLYLRRRHQRERSLPPPALSLNGTTLIELQANITCARLYSVANVNTYNVTANQGTISNFTSTNQFTLNSTASPPRL